MSSSTRSSSLVPSGPSAAGGTWPWRAWSALPCREMLLAASSVPRSTSSRTADVRHQRRSNRGRKWPGLGADSFVFRTRPAEATSNRDRFGIVELINFRGADEVTSEGRGAGRNQYDACSSPDLQVRTLR